MNSLNRVLVAEESGGRLPDVAFDLIPLDYIAGAVALLLPC